MSTKMMLHRNKMYIILPLLRLLAKPMDILMSEIALVGA